MTRPKPKRPTKRRRKPKMGGYRPGAGRKSVFGVKAVSKPFAMDFTRDGRRALRALEKRTKLSRNAILGTLALQFADGLAFVDAAPFPNKAQDVLSIRVPPDAAARLEAARERTGRGYSDIGEALVVWHGPSATFPEALRPSRRRRTGRRRP